MTFDSINPHCFASIGAPCFESVGFVPISLSSYRIHKRKGAWSNPSGSLDFVSIRCSRFRIQLTSMDSCNVSNTSKAKFQGRRGRLGVKGGSTRGMHATSLQSHVLYRYEGNRYEILGSNRAVLRGTSLRIEHISQAVDPNATKFLQQLAYKVKNNPAKF